MVTCLFIVQEIKEKKRKREIKSKKIDKRKKSKSNIRIQAYYDKYATIDSLLSSS